MTVAYDLSATAMLANLSISRWTASVHDKHITKDVIDNHAAKEKTGRFTKKIINKAGMKAISDVVSRARTYHVAVTLPWSGDGARILPAAKFMEYSAEMRKFKAEFEAAVSLFENEYHTLKDQARDELGTMYDENNYPHLSEIRDKFAFDTDICPIPNANDFRVNLSVEAVEEIKKEFADREKDVLNKAVKHIWKKMFEVVKHMHERLSTEDAVFQKTTITNLQKIVDDLPMMNITNDQDLEAMRLEIQDKLCAYTPEEIRKDPEKRAEVSATADEIMKKMEGYC